MRIAVTGHRPNKLWGYDYHHPNYIRLGSTLRNLLIKHDATLAISGMALGVDTIFALVALKLGTPLESAIPCQNMDKLWRPESKQLFNSILERATTVTLVTDKPYKPQYMQTRNEYMVDHCDLLIAVWDGTPGGTYNCIRYAKQVGKQIIYINPKNFTEVH